MVTSITPPHMHISFEELLRAGILAIKTVGQPGVHGAVVAGMHGMGVRTPMAAAVAAATVGFDIELHMPKGRIFIIGTLSIMFAIGIVVVTMFFGRTIIELGATPKLHLSIAPPHTRFPISDLLNLKK